MLNDIWDTGIIGVIVCNQGIDVSSSTTLYTPTEFSNYISGKATATGVLDSNVIVGKANYANSAGWAKANDVYDWAKASSKPSYSASEVGAATSGHTHDGRYMRWNGSAADVNSMGWGTLTSANGYTILSHCSSSDGGDWGMVNKGGQIFMQLDGYYYQNEGRYRVLDTSNISMSFSNGVLTITYNS